MYAWCLRASHWVVEEAASGEEALFVAPTFRPDVIVMDIRLPGLDGLQATRWLKQHRTTKHIPIVACTGVERSRAEPRAIEAGCDDIVEKPCSPESLRNLLESFIYEGW
jgi:CheY-like chemotaxis protein